jgi:hypothetical protein
MFFTVEPIAVISAIWRSHQPFFFVKTDGFTGESGFLGNLTDIHSASPLDLTLAGRFKLSPSEEYHVIRPSTPRVHWAILERILLCHKLNYSRCKACPA